ncbi:hypothetical protein H257_10540 [Aphanomyces astaci]|uniref:PDZ domain-containing protein n=1 Tax=Aphanomyces astaci TaxID=112090 RepID=W4G6J7_APHAT|nr:hypothetical protein H257_10540 [Aphanomyces astaci]ETV74916.1 hypothetical protein H257_10540 [Aphanomyces astaci]|eukprot:XP_009835420.1 hypothetical protein H257_10540 [Aphanomyces astaci]
MLVEVDVHKGDHGFGIYFTRVKSHVLVEGFVRADDGTPGPAEHAGTIVIDDVLEQINGLDITGMEMADVINQLRAAPRGVNVLTFRRVDVAPPPPSNNFMSIPMNQDDEWQSPEWWDEFDKLKDAEHDTWNGSILSEAAFCDHLYADSDAQHRSYLRQQYPIIMAKFQASFHPWPTPVLSCEPTTYCPRHTKSHNALSTIQPSACLRGLLECIRIKFGWTRGETQAFRLALQAQHQIGSALDLVCAMRQRDGRALVLHQAAAPRQQSTPQTKFPRLTNSMWAFVSATAMHGLSADELAFVNNINVN